MDQTERGTTRRTEAEPAWSAGDRQRRNAYFKEFIPAILAYAVILVLVLVLVDQESSWAWLWWQLPILPMVGVGVAFYRFLRQADEYIRTVQFQTMAVGFAAGIFASLVFGFLGIAGITTRATGWVVFGVAVAAWMVSLGWVGRR